MSKMVKKPLDMLGRPLHDLRISVTDRCNFRCQYCMPAEIFGPDYPFLTSDKLLSFDEITYLAKLFVSLGVNKLRITGGEPLLRKDLPKLISQLRKIDGVKDIAMTTNGVLLKKFAKDLKAAGLNRVTVSLDSLDDERFAKMNGVGVKVKTVLEGMEAAEQAGLQVKINMVVQRGVNDQDILPMARFFKGTGRILRFIEFMDVGNFNNWKLEQVVPTSEIVRLIHEEMPLEPVDPNYYGEVAKRYRYQGTTEEIGFVSSVTQAFCSTCTRARLSAEGKLYTCLFASDGVDLREPLRSGMAETDLLNLIAQVWEQRHDRYSEMRLSNTKGLNKKKIEMSHIGG